MAEHPQHTLSDPTPMQWLVSVRNERELAVAARFRIDIIDLKEPRKGALAPVDRRLWETIGSRIQPPDSARPIQWSAALGEQDTAVGKARHLPSAFAFAKAGPSGCRDGNALRRLWDAVRSELDPRIELVTVAYADADDAACVPPEKVLAETPQAGLRRCLLDTGTKNGRSSVDCMGIQRLRRFQRTARELGIWWALAGSIRASDVERLASAGIHPNCVAVRGDVCDVDRTGQICPQRMQAWSVLMDRISASVV